MIIREPQVQATYYYLERTAADHYPSVQERRQTFVTEVQRMVTALAGWLSLPTPPDLPGIEDWDESAAGALQPLMIMAPFEGLTNASARLAAYRLRDLLLLRVVLSRAGDHEPDMWSMMDQALGPAPTATTWLATARYWCATAPRPPEELERDHLMPLKTPFGVLSLGQGARAHLLVYPDARTEGRAAAFLSVGAPELDSYPVEARHRLASYADHASQMTRDQQQAVDRLIQEAQTWGAPRRPLGLLSPAQAELDSLHTTYDALLEDLHRTRQNAHQIRTLALEYRSRLLASGLWEAGPGVWESQVAKLDAMAAEIEGDVEHIDAGLRRIELIGRGFQTRAVLLHSERERLLIFVVAVLGLALLAVLVIDTDPVLMLLRLLMLGLVAAALWLSWRRWQAGAGP